MMKLPGIDIPKISEDIRAQVREDLQPFIDGIEEIAAKLDETNRLLALLVVSR